MIPLHHPPQIGGEKESVLRAIESGHLSGDGPASAECAALLAEILGARCAMLTPSGSAALDLAHLLCDLRAGDEVILPSFTFPSAANAAILAGAVPVFVDIRPDTMNIDETKIEAAITSRTRAICMTHYAGVSCEMDAIGDIAARHNLRVIEDAAHAVGASYRGKVLGTIGDLGCLSFHATKNVTMGEGGALLVNDPALISRAEILREKGTDRAAYLRGEAPRYQWTDLGSSYLSGELPAAYLVPQLLAIEEITADRRASYARYMQLLAPLQEAGLLELPVIPEDCCPNAHIFYIKVRDEEERDRLMKHLAARGVETAFHYVPLHSSPAGRRFGRFSGEDVHTTRESRRLLRLPLYFRLDPADLTAVVAGLYAFYDVPFEGKER